MLHNKVLPKRNVGIFFLTIENAIALRSPFEDGKKSAYLVKDDDYSKN